MKLEELVKEIGGKYLRSESEETEKFTIVFPNSHTAMLTFIKELEYMEDNSVLSVFDERNDLVISVSVSFTKACVSLKEYMKP